MVVIKLHIREIKIFVNLAVPWIILMKPHAHGYDMVRGRKMTNQGPDRYFSENLTLDQLYSSTLWCAHAQIHNNV